MSAESDVVSQSEVEAILASIAMEKTEIPILGGKRRKEGDPEPSIQAYDFRNPSFLGQSELRRLRIKSEEFIQTLAAELTLMLRAEFALQMSRLETVPYRQIREALPTPSHVTLFRLKPVKAMCIFELIPSLGLTVVDRMCGGPGHSVNSEREFTDLEKVVLDYFIEKVISQYASAWIKYQRFEHEVIEHENTVRFLNIVENDEIMLVLEMEARFGDMIGPLKFVVPFAILAPILDQMMAEISVESKRLTPAERPPSTDPTMLDIPVPVSFHWRGAQMTLRDLSQLTVGDVVMLDDRICERAVMELGNLPLFYADFDRSTTPATAKILRKIE